MIKKLFSILLTLSIVVQSTAPLTHAQSTRRGRTRVSNPVSENAVDLNTLPAFPEDQNRPEVDWSEVDWEREIVLPEAQQEFLRELDELEIKGEFDKIEELQQNLKKPFYSKEVMNGLNIPSDIQKVVEEFYPTESDITSQDTTNEETSDGSISGDAVDVTPLIERVRKPRVDKEKLKQQLRAVQIRKKIDSGEFFETDSIDEFSPLEPLENSIDDQQVINIQDFSPVNKPNRFQNQEVPFQDVQVELETQQNTPNKLKTLQELKKEPVFQEEVQTSWLDSFIKKLIPTATAQIVLPRLMEAYDGIENHPIEYLLFQLTERQNSDGSFGNALNYEVSANIAFILSDFNRTQNQTYQDLIDYLKNAPVKNTREKAMKARILMSLGLPYQTLFDEVIASQNSNGGFGLQKNYSSDVITTLEVLLAMLSKDAIENSGSTTFDNTIIKSLLYLLTQIETDGSMRYKTGAPISYYLMNRTVQTLELYRPFSVTVNQQEISINQKVNDMLALLASQYDQDLFELSETKKTINLLMTLESFQQYDVYPEDQAALKEHINNQFISSSITLGSQFETIAALRALAQPDVVIGSIIPTTSLINKRQSTFQVKVENIGYKTTNELQIYEYIDKYLHRGSSFNLSDLGFVLPPNTIGTITFHYGFSFTLDDTIFDYYIEADEEHSYENNWKTEHFSFAADPEFPALQSYAIATQYSNSTSAGVNVRWDQQDDPNRKSYVILLREEGTTQWEATTIPNEWNGAFLTGLTEGTNYEVSVGAIGLDDSFCYYDEALSTVTVNSNDALNTGEVTGHITVNNKALSDGYIRGYGVSANSDEAGQFSDPEVAHGTNAAWVGLDHLEDFKHVFPVPKNGITDDVRILTRLKEDNEAPQLSIAELRYAENHNYTVRNQNIAELLVVGSDNIAFARAEFYYWDPVEQLWFYIGGTSDGYGDAFFYDWYIPAELLGSGYKIKTIVYDYQENSTESEWGPFQIVDGAIPTGTVEILGLQNNEWALGETYTIEWNVGSTNNLSYQNITLNYGIQSNRLESNYDLTKNSYEYTLPNSGFYISDDANIEIESCDQYYTCSKIESTSFKIKNNSPTAKNPWQPNMIVQDTFTTVQGVSRYINSIERQPNGDVEMIYLEYDYSQSGSYIYNLNYRKLVNGQWQNPVNVESYSYSNSDTIRPRISTVITEKQSNGTLHIAYEVSDDAASNTINSTEVYYAKVFNNQVHKRQMTNTNIRSSLPYFAISPNGTIYLIWRTGFDYETYTGISTLFFSQTNDGINWSTNSQLMSGGGRFPGVIFEGEDMIISYLYNDQIHFIKRTNGTNSNIITIKNRRIPKNRLDVFTNDSSQFNLIVEPNPDNSQEYLWLDSITTYSDLESILTTNNFTEISGIGNEWKRFQYGNNASFPIMHKNIDGSYDYFAKRLRPEFTYYLYSIQHTNINVNFSNGTFSINKSKHLVDNLKDEQIDGFRTQQRTDKSSYHIFYNINQNEYPYYLTRPRYLFYDGNSTQFNYPLASPVFSVSSSYDLFPSSYNDLIHIYVPARRAGEDILAFNTADFSSIINNQFIPTSPNSNSITSLTDIPFEWQHTGGTADSYEFWLGTHEYYLELEEDSLTQTAALVDQLDPSTTYYWQVVAVQGSERVYSSVWHFTTPSGDPAEMSLIQNGNTVLNQESYSLGSTQYGNATNYSFDIQNTGGGVITLNETDPITFTNNDDQIFTIKTPPTPTTITATSPSTFEIEVNPPSAGVYTATLNINSNVPNQPVYSVDLSVLVQQRSGSSITGPVNLKIIDGATQEVLPMGELIEVPQPTLQFTIRDASPTKLYGYTIQVDDDGTFDSGASGNEGDVHNFTFSPSSIDTPEVNYEMPEALGENYYFWRVRSTDENDNTSIWTYANNGNRAFLIQNHYEFLFDGHIRETQHGGKDITLSGGGLAYKASYDNEPTNMAVFFDGKDDKLTLKHDVRGGDLTLSAWIFATENGLIKPLIDRKRYSLIVNSSEEVVWTIHDDLTDSPVSINSSALTPGWHHVVASIQEGNYSRLYVDGTQVGEQTGALSIKQGPFYEDEKVNVGYSDGNWYQGGLDDLNIWKKALTAQEITDLYTPLPAPPADESLSFSTAQLNFVDTYFGEQSTQTVSIISDNSQTPTITHLISSCNAISPMGWLDPVAYQNTSFNTDVNNWEQWPSTTNNDQDRASQLILSHTPSDFAEGRGSAKIEVQYDSQELWEAQLLQPGIPVNLGEYYQLSFFAKADQSTSIQAGIYEGLQPSSPAIGAENSFDLTTDWQFFSVPITISKQDANARLQFSLGGSSKTVWIDEVNLQKVTQPATLNPSQQFNFNFSPTKVKQYRCELTVHTLPGNQYTLEMYGIGKDFVFDREEPGVFTPLDPLIPLSEPEAALPFFDDFANLALWTDNSQGSYTVSSGELTATGMGSSGQNIAIQLNPTHTGNFKVEFDFSFSEEDSGAALLFGLSTTTDGTGSGSFLQISSEGAGSYQAIPAQLSSGSLTLGSTPISFTALETYHASLEFNGANYSLIIRNSLGDTTIETGTMADLGLTYEFIFIGEPASASSSTGSIVIDNVEFTNL